VVLLAVDQEAAHVRDQYSEVSVPDLDAWRKQIQTLETYFAGNEAKSQAMRWLTRLRLLEAVPFQYLVPAEEMLPTETVRFFHIDRNWVDALIDGAMSVTLTSTREKQWLLQDDDGQARYVSIMSELDTAENLTDAYRNFVAMQSNASTATKQSGGRLTGFLLRSSLVRDFPGIEVQGYRSESGNPWKAEKQVSLHRFARLSDTVIMVVFNGCPTHVRFQEPAEGIRLGVDGDENQFELKLKQADGSLVPPSATSSIPVRKRDSRDRSVLDILGMYKSMKNKISSGVLDASFSDQESALLGTQMLQYPYQQDFVPYDQMDSIDSPHPHKGALNWGGDS
jgi:hypothetical protein